MAAGDSSHPYSIFGAPGVMPISACISKNARALQECAQSTRKFFKNGTNIFDCFFKKVIIPATNPEFWLQTQKKDKSSVNLIHFG